MPYSAKLLSAIAALAFGAAPAIAQDTQTANEQGVTVRVDLDAWDTEPLYSGWSANELLEEEVYGANGDQIGDVEDFLISPEGKIAAVVVEGGGFLDIGDSHVAVPWDRVTRFGVSSISVPIEEGNLEEYGLFGGVDDITAPGGNWRLRNLIGDYIALENGAGYGYVRDVIFSRDGSIEAVIGNPAYGYGYGVGPRPLPYNTAYDPYGPYYSVPYAVTDLENLEPFNYGKLDNAGESATAADGNQEMEEEQEQG